MKKKVVKTRHIGDITINSFPDGRHKIVDSSKKAPVYIPSLEGMVKKYTKNHNKPTASFSKALLYIPIVYGNEVEPTTKGAYEILGLSTPQNRKIPCSQREKEIRHAILKL